MNQATGIGISTIIIIILAIFYMKSPKETCDSSIGVRNDFYNYYGLRDVEYNPLLLYRAEQLETTNDACLLFYDYMNLLPTSVPILSKSMIIKALRGAGKTHIRQCVISKLPRENHIQLNIYGKKVDEYLNNFLSNIDLLTEPDYVKIQKYWTQKHFVQLLLTELVSTFVSSDYFEILIEKRSRLSFQNRQEIAVILGLYAKKDPDQLCKLINLLLFEQTECFLRNCNINCNDIQSTASTKQTFTELKKIHDEIKVKRYTLATTDAALMILLGMQVKTEISPLLYLQSSHLDQLDSLISFLNNLGLSISVFVDSLDESIHFFDSQDANLDALQAFTKSIINPEVLQFALSDWQETVTTTSKMAFYIFIPEVPSVPMNITWTRKDKIPLVALKWNELQLINYADYILNYLRKQSPFACKNLPNICLILGGQDLCLKYMKRLRHPRDFHIFFNILVEYINADIAERDPQFIATETHLIHAFDKFQEHILKETLTNNQ